MAFNGTQQVYEASLGNHSEVTRLDTSYPGELYVVMVLLLLFSVIGTAGNGLVLYVFSKKKDTLVSTQCIIALATVDFVTCVFVIPCTIYMEYTAFNIGSDFFCKFYQFLITSSIPFSALIMVAIALDRYLCICHPFLKILTVGRSKVMICVLWLVAGSLGVCVALTFSVYKSVSRYHSNNITSASGSNGISETMVAQSPLVTPGLHGYGVNLNDVIIPLNSTNLYTYYTTKISVESRLDHSIEDDYMIVNSGVCAITDLILTKEFFFYYQKLYNIIFPLCLVIVVVLYVMIYRSVLVRRNKRQKQKSKALLLVKTTNVTQASCSVATETVSVNGDHSRVHSGYVEHSGVHEGLDAQTDLGVHKGKGVQSTLSVPTGGQTVHNIRADNAQCGGKLSVDRKSQSELKQVKKRKLFKPRSSDVDERKRSKADSTRLANIKTAAMLFVVNVVFFVSFMPAFLTTLNFIPFSLTLFYLYFANNVANPVIYSFMNKNFRSDLARLFGYKAQ